MNEAERERLIKKDIASIENRVRHAFNQGYEMGMKDREKLNCTDCIIEKSDDFIKSHTAMMMAKDALSRSEIPNTCGDAISRADARHLIAETNRKSLGYISTKVFKILYDGIDKLPSVTPQQRTGRWIKQNYGWNWQCSECGFVTPPSAKEIFTFCPKCGVKMEVEE